MILSRTRLGILTATMVSAAALMAAPLTPAAAQSGTTEEELLLEEESATGEEGEADKKEDAAGDEPTAAENEAAAEEEAAADGEVQPAPEEEAVEPSAEAEAGAESEVTAEAQATDGDEATAEDEGAAEDEIVPEEEQAAEETDSDEAGAEDEAAAEVESAETEEAASGDTTEATAEEEATVDAEADADLTEEAATEDEATDADSTEEAAAAEEASAAETPPEPEEDVEAPPEVSDEAEENAKELLADDTPAEDLSDQELRERMGAYRALLEEPQLSAETSGALRERLKADRKVLRARVAEADAADVEAATRAEAASEDDESSVDQAVDSVTGLFKDDDDSDDDEGMSNTNKALIAGGLAAAAIALPLLLMPDEEETTRIVTQTQTQPVPVQNLSDAELGQRIMALQQAVDDDTTYTASQRQRFAEELEVARDELRWRLRRDREEREALYREADSYDVPVNYVVPQQDYEPAIWAAEVDQDQIWRQLLAAPRGDLPEAQYTRQELSRNIEWIVTRPGVREALPSIELDTITFGYNEDFLREEELYDLDRIARLIEQVVVAHPEEIFLIEGHTDAAGSQEYNWRLSQRRAKAVKSLITEYYLVPPGNLMTAGLGEAYLKIWTPGPEEENRRVTIRRVTPLVAGYDYR